MTRSANSIRNITAALLGQFFGIIISFISRIVFVRILGSEYLGLNGLFTNILTILSLAELGIGEAITFSLYKPLATNDNQKTCMLMQFYRKVYIIIALVVLSMGLLLIPFLKIIISDVPNISESITLIYILFVVNTSISYFFSYKRSLIIADQNRYIASIYRYGFYFLLNVSQIIFLIIKKNYIVFLLLQILFTLIENIAISKKANRMYTFLKDSKKIPLDNESKLSIVKNTKAMVMHKAGGILVSSTDNILLTRFVSLSVVGIYSNYYMIISALNTIFGQLYNSVIASVGNLFATEKENKIYDIFKKINFLSFYIISFSAICLICLYNDFIELWIGKEYLFSFDIVLIIVVNYFISGLRKPVITFKEAAGLFYKDRWKSIAEAIANIIFSIILALKFGTLGVFLGTFISSICVCVWVEPYVVYKYGFKIKLREYFKVYTNYCFITIIIGFICFIVCRLLKFNLLINLLLKLFICIFSHATIVLILFHNSNEYKYFKCLIKDKLNNTKKRLKGDI